MKNIVILLILPLILVASSFALEPERACQFKKTRALSRYLPCLFNAESKLKGTVENDKYKSRIRSCDKKFVRSWQKAIDQTAKKNAECFDRLLSNNDYKDFIHEHLEEVANLLGKSQALDGRGKKCRTSKNSLIAKYYQCRFTAEGNFLKTSETSKYFKQIAKCEEVFSAKWQKVLDKASGGCYDNGLNYDSYKELIGDNSDRIILALAGESQLKPVELSIIGSPLNLIANGSSGSITVTNNSLIESAKNISPDLSSAGLTDNVSVTSNACSDLAPSSTCVITFSPSDTPVPLTNFILKGDNTEEVIGALAVVAEEINLDVAGSPLTLVANGTAGNMTVTNNSNSTATGITAELSGTALDGNVTITGNTCANLAAGDSCVLTFTPDSAVVVATNFNIQGMNTESTPAIISVVAQPTLTVGGSPLNLTANGGTGNLTITNTSAVVTALNITSDFSGTALDGNVSETGNTCASVAPLASCVLTFTPGNSVVAATDFTIQGSNTLAATASIEIESGSTLTAINPNTGSASGGTGVTLTGTGLTGATGITFDGVAATSVNVINSTTVTAVAPAHAAGAVDIVINTPAGGATLSNGYTYNATAVGQAAFGGTIACLNGGLNNLIAATTDNSVSIVWGGLGTAIGAGGQSNSDGASNTTAIVAALGNNGGEPYAAQLCNDYEVDSQGNTPCQAGNACYNDWFLPAGNNFGASGQLNCLFTNRNAIGGFAAAVYWSSTEFNGNPSLQAWSQFFGDGGQLFNPKSINSRARCVRAFVP